MKVARIASAPFAVPLRRPFAVGGQRVVERSGCLVRITDEDGVHGFGEATPLPGLHAESPADVARALDALRPDLEGRVFDDFAAFAAHAASLRRARADGGGPALGFALETAALGLLAHRAETVPAALLAAEPRPVVELSGFFDGAPDDAEGVLATGGLARFPSLKVKVGRRAIPTERRLLEVLLAGLPPRTRLRLDGNRALTPAQARELLRGLPSERVEYLEEPLTDPRGLVDLAARTGFAVALDESLHDPALADLRRAPGVAAWIVKPARLGSWRAVTDLAAGAVARGVGCVLSSCLETGLGLHAQVQMAAGLPGPARAAGLATESLLAADTVEPPFDARAGSVETRAWQGAPAPVFLEQVGLGPGDPP